MMATTPTGMVVLMLPGRLSRPAAAPRRAPEVPSERRLMDGMSKDAGRTWARTTKLTRGGGRNHTHARRPVNAHPDFYALWADAHGSKTSESNLYFCDKKGNVWGLP